MLEPTAGEILIDGKLVSEERPEALRRGIGYVIQSIGLFPHMSVSENIAVVPRLLRWEQGRIERRVDELLELIGLEPASIARSIRASSREEKRSVSVWRAPLPRIRRCFSWTSLSGPSTRSTASSSRGSFSRIQRRLRKTVVFVTHDLDEAIRLADRIVLLNKGHLVQADSPENLLSHPKNNFVKNFVGTDRALKRLARFTVRGLHARGPGPLPARREFAQRIAALHAENARFVWILEREGRLFGWINVIEASGQENPKRALTRINPAESAVMPSFSLKEALSRMLDQGMKVVPVVGEDGRLVGEISLADIERITEA